jgi:hypothetical protein
MANRKLDVPQIHVEDSSSDWSDYECDTKKKPRWSFHEYLLREGTHKEYLLCVVENVSCGACCTIEIAFDDLVVFPSRLQT